MPGPNMFQNLLNKNGFTDVVGKNCSCEPPLAQVSYSLFLPAHVEKFWKRNGKEVSSSQSVCLGCGPVSGHDFLRELFAPNLCCLDVWISRGGSRHELVPSGPLWRGIIAVAIIIGSSFLLGNLPTGCSPRMTTTGSSDYPSWIYASHSTCRPNLLRQQPNIKVKLTTPSEIEPATCFEETRKRGRL